MKKSLVELRLQSGEVSPALIDFVVHLHFDLVFFSEAQDHLTDVLYSQPFADVFWRDESKSVCFNQVINPRPTGFNCKSKLSL